MNFSNILIIILLLYIKSIYLDFVAATAYTGLCLRHPQASTVNNLTSCPYNIHINRGALSRKYKRKGTESSESKIDTTTKIRENLGDKSNFSEVENGSKQQHDSSSLHDAHQSNTGTEMQYRIDNDEEWVEVNEDDEFETFFRGKQSIVFGGRRICSTFMTCMER